MKTNLTTAVAVFALGLSACGGGDNSQPVPTQAALCVETTQGVHATVTASLRVVNGIIDSPTINLSIAGAPTDFGNVALDTTSPITQIQEGCYDAQIIPTDVTKAFMVDHIPVDHDSVTTVFSTGTLADGTQSGVVAEESLTVPPSGQAEVQVINAAFPVTSTVTPAGITVSFIPAPADATTTGTQTLTIPSGQSAAPVLLPAGKYQIRVHADFTCTGSGPCNTPAEIIYVTDPDGVSLPPAGVFQFAVISTSGTLGPSVPDGYVLLLLDATGGSALIPTSIETE